VEAAHVMKMKYCKSRSATHPPNPPVDQQELPPIYLTQAANTARPPTSVANLHPTAHPIPDKQQETGHIQEAGVVRSDVEEVVSYPPSEHPNLL